ncbi:MAG: hypothetical protein CVU84_04135 [Firmicutes bacterium HGW-Firmicutes-1]|jgi:diguanylate cyclase (GGDEF)-like protein|nr:MAG: hypothetical protein CVU84_04135 [Firmicutes bacterium HGW-Firmicutes-1]
MGRILQYEKKYIGIYSGTLCILFAYMVLFFNEMKEDQLLILGISMIFFVFLLTIVLYHFKYFDRINIFITLKYINLFSLGILFYNENIFILVTASLCYIMICIELILTLFQEDITKRNRMFFFTFVPMIICSFVLWFAKDLNWIQLLFLIQFSALLFGIYKIIDLNGDEMREKIADGIKLWESSQHSNQELLSTQNEVKIAYQQMEKQKMDMEQTNKTLNRITSEMYIQNELLRYIGSTLELDQLMDLVTDSIIGAIGVDTCSLIIHNVEQDKYYFKTKTNYNVDIEQQLKNALSEGNLAKYFSEKNSHIDSYVNTSDYPFIQDRPVGSLIIIPLIRNNSIYGLLISEHASTGFFGETNLQFFQSIATQINIAVNNASLYTRMEEMATKDGLSGLYNRRHFQKMLVDLFNKIKEKGTMSVTMFDIDKFKNVNDTYGHLFGDEAIKMVSRIAQKYALLHGGFAGRYGGEEFVIVLPNIGLRDSVEIMKNMHNELKKEPLYYNRDRLVYINISIGVTAYPDFGTSAEDLLNRADNAMYYSKDHGRGKITVDDINLNE